MRTLLRGGLVIDPSGVSAADVLIEDDRIAAVCTPEESTRSGSQVDSTIDATGQFILPGGVDVHTHLDNMVSGVKTSDSFATGTAAAAWGGTTTIVDFVQHSRGQDVLENLGMRHKMAAGNAAIDYGFHQIIGEVDERSMRAMQVLCTERGITSFKFFMAFPGELMSNDRDLLLAMQHAARIGATVMVHAENGLAVELLRDQSAARGESGPKHHAATRPAILEGEATNRAVQLARIAGNPTLYFVHVSALDAVDVIGAARREGQPVFAETCPHYLFLSAEDVQLAPGRDGANFLCAPPLRSSAEGHADRLWRALRIGELAIVSTDHCPFCWKDQREPLSHDFRLLPNGIAGIEHRTVLMYQAVIRGQLSPARWVDLCATSPARMFGLYPRKGRVLPGADADVVIFDPDGTTAISASTHHMNVDFSVYEGMTLRGSVRTVLSRGVVLVHEAEWVGPRDGGQFLQRRRSDPTDI